METHVIALFLIGLFANVVEAISGFGSTVISVTLGAHFFSIDRLIPALVPVNILLSLYLVTAHRQHIDKTLLIRHILPFMGAGALIGIAFFNILAGNFLKRMLGFLVVIFCVRELYKLWKKHPAPFIPLYWSRFWILMGGVVHGIYASGGPLLVYALSGMALDKSKLRSTLSTVWLILNSILLLSYVFTGRINGETLQFSLIFLPALPLGIVLGEWLHERIDEYRFRIGVFVVLLGAGLGLALR